MRGGGRRIEAVGGKVRERGQCVLCVVCVDAYKNNTTQRGRERGS